MNLGEARFQSHLVMGNTMAIGYDGRAAAFSIGMWLTPDVGLVAWSNPVSAGLWALQDLIPFWGSARAIAKAITVCSQ
jgi:hypothetical protein